MVTADVPGVATIDRSTAPSTRVIRLGLLGLGQIGSAVARLATAPDAPTAIQIVGALVRNPARDRDAPVPRALIAADPARLFAERPDVLVEVLGGTSPAFDLVRRALEAGIPVVTANKSLLAAHGATLEAIASDSGTPLLFEASVLAGVPFIGALARRPHAARVNRIEGILNGTSNFVLSRMNHVSGPVDEAVADAQRLGYAEPDPANDIDGIDAAEKLAVLLRVLGWGTVPPGVMARRGIGALDTRDVRHARELGGMLRPVAFAERHARGVAAWVEPCFIPEGHPLADVDGVENAIRLHTPHGIVLHRGPGAGPAATAATILDDVVEAAAGTVGAPRRAPSTAAPLTPAATRWLVRLDADCELPAPEDLADLLASFGIWVLRWGPTRLAGGPRGSTCLLTHAVERDRVERALAALDATCHARTTALRALEA